VGWVGGAAGANRDVAGEYSPAGAECRAEEFAVWRACVTWLAGTMAWVFAWYRRLGEKKSLIGVNSSHLPVAQTV
jgi:hypothetical protein